MQSHRIRRSLNVACLAMLLAACTSDTWYHQYKFIGKDGWRKTDTLSFTLPPLSVDTVFSGFVGLRITPSFPYRKLWFALEYQCDSVFSSDTICYELSDSTGRLDGKGLSSLQYEQPAFTIQMPKDKEGEIRIRHLMKKEIIPYIREVGIRLR